MPCWFPSGQDQEEYINNFGIKVIYPQNLQPTTLDPETLAPGEGTHSGSEESSSMSVSAGGSSSVSESSGSSPYRGQVDPMAKIIRVGSVRLGQWKEYHDWYIYFIVLQYIIQFAIQSWGPMLFSTLLAAVTSVLLVAPDCTASWHALIDGIKTPTESTK